MKTCNACRESKPLDAFYTRKNAAGELVPRGTCKVCWTAQSLANQRANPERTRDYGRTARAKVSRRERTLRDKYGMTSSPASASRMPSWPTTSVTTAGTSE